MDQIEENTTELHSIGRASVLSGVPIETIRIWERRYKAVEPVRTAGGHRKYTGEDVRYLAALKALVDEGTRIGKITKLPREEVLRAAEPGSWKALPENEFDELTQRIVRSARDLDSEAVSRLLAEPLATRPPLDVVGGCYLPLLKRIGELWHDGEISIAVEHLVERAVSSEIQSLMRRLPTTPDGPLAICAALEGDRHEVGLLAASLYMQSQGIRITYLGGDLPLPDLDSAVRRVRPDIILISAMLTPPTDLVKQLLEHSSKSHFRRASKMLGGPGLSQLADMLPMFTYCPTLGVFLDKLPRLVEQIGH